MNSAILITFTHNVVGTDLGSVYSNAVPRKGERVRISNIGVFLVEEVEWFFEYEGVPGGKANVTVSVAK
jgi:hypothetical protein